MIREGMRSDNALNDHDGGTGILSKQEPFTLFRAGTGGGNHSQQFETWREKIEPIVQETGTVLLILTLHRVSYLQYHLSRSSKMRKPSHISSPINASLSLSPSLSPSRGPRSPQ